jgi:hypothetical protein
LRQISGVGFASWSGEVIFLGGSFRKAWGKSLIDSVESGRADRVGAIFLALFVFFGSSSLRSVADFRLRWRCGLNPIVAARLLGASPSLTVIWRRLCSRVGFGFDAACSWGVPEPTPVVRFAFPFSI